MNEPVPARLTAAAEHFNKQFLPRFATVPDIKPETIIAGTARMAGTMLFRSFTAPDEARLKGPKLLDILFETLRSAGHDISDQSLDNKDATTAASQLWLRESQALLDPIVLAYSKSAGLSPEEAAHALAIAAALFVHDCASVLEVRKGAAIAAAGFAEGCKKAPAPQAQQAQPQQRQQAQPQQRANWSLSPVVEKPASALKAAAVAPEATTSAPASLTKYFVSFAVWYIGAMVAAAFALSALGARGTAVNTIVFMVTIWIVGVQFVKNRGRLWLPGEKWRLIFGFLLITLAFDAAVTALTLRDRAPVSLILGVAAFIAVLRFFWLWLVLGPLARRTFSRYAKR